MVTGAEPGAGTEAGAGAGAGARAGAGAAAAPPRQATAVPLRVEYDNRHGGRWTMLSGAAREWLWRGPGTGRDSVTPGDAFVDAGGLEECVPTVRGLPDHGDAWSRPWRAVGAGAAAVDCPDFTLVRRITHHDGVVLADYRLSAVPGYRFVWAAHALLDLSPAARVEAPAGTPTRVYPEAAALLPGGIWPAGAPWLTGPWPAPLGDPWHELGPDDGTAIGAVLVGCPSVRVVDGSDALTLRIEADGQPTSTAVWRNLRGWPDESPYRSIGVEPMLGATFDLASAGPDDAAVVPAGGEVKWRLTISAHRSTGSDSR